MGVAETRRGRDGGCLRRSWRQPKKGNVDDDVVKSNSNKYEYDNENPQVFFAWRGKNPIQVPRAAAKKDDVEPKALFSKLVWISGRLVPFVDVGPNRITRNHKRFTRLEGGKNRYKFHGPPPKRMTPSQKKVQHEDFPGGHPS